MPRNGTVIYVDQWTTELVEQNENWVVLFGDNNMHYGKGGQAIIRDLPQAFGIPTKKEPKQDDSSYFTDDEYPANCMHILEAFQRLPLDELKRGEKVLVLPKAGLDTGLAQLPNKAPRTYQFLEQLLAAYVSTIVGLPSKEAT